MDRKITIALISTLSLTGCHLGDPTAKHHRASVTTVSNDVCVTIQPEEDEHISGLIINEVGNSENKLEKFATIAAAPNKCIPDFGYKYEVGRAYNFSVIVESSDKSKKGTIALSRIFSADFSLWSQNGKLEVSPIN